MGREAALILDLYETKKQLATLTEVAPVPST